MDARSKRRGGARTGAGRKKLDKASSKLKKMGMRVSADTYGRWKELKTLRRAKTDAELLEYLLDLAASADQDSSFSTGPLMSTPVTSRGARVPLRMHRAEEGATATSPMPSFINPPTAQSVMTKSILSETLPTIQGNPFSSDSEDETYVCPGEESVESSDSPISSCGDDSDSDSPDISHAISQLLSSGSEPEDSDDQTDGSLDSGSESVDEQEFVPSSISGFSATANVDSIVDSVKVVVSVQQLMQLIPSVCLRENCHLPLKAREEYQGCGVLIHLTCVAGHRFTWSSSPAHVNHEGSAIYGNNLLLASSLLLSGNSFAKVQLMFRFMGLKMISKAMYYRYQNAYMITPIEDYWQQHQLDTLSKTAGRSLILSGDGRCDSPGFSAKYCTYSLMDTETNLIVHTVTLKRSEVAYKSPNMETEGMRRALKFLEGKVTISEIVTDASRSIMALLESDFPDYYHSLDVWHKSKKLKKSLFEVSKAKGMEKVGMWADRIVNHFWWCCWKCERDEEKLKTAWISVLHHVCDEHQWETGECVHDEHNADEDHIPYFNKGDKDFEALQKLVLNAKWLETLRHYVRFRHTGLLEVFHNVILAYVSKRLSFSDKGYLVRVLLAVLDHNHNINRSFKQTSTSESTATDETPEEKRQFHRVWRRRSNRWDAIPVKVDKDYGYIMEITKAIFALRYSTPVPLRRVERRKRLGSTITPIVPPATA